MYDAKLLSTRLLMSRRDLKWNQDDLARESGVSRGYISNIERGHISNVGIEVVFALANALGVSVKYLTGLSDDPFGDEPPRDEPDELSAYQSEEYLNYEIRQPAIRKLTKRMIDIFLQLSARDQEIIVTMAQTMADTDHLHVFGKPE